MKKKVVILIVSFLYFIGFNSCKKIKTEDPVYIGEWVSKPGYYQFFLTFDSGSNGKYWTIGYNHVNNSQHPYSGRAKVDLLSKQIYVGITKFRILEHPHTYSTPPDSINIFGSWRHTAGVKMTLQNSILHSKVTIDFYKLKD